LNIKKSEHTGGMNAAKKLLELKTLVPDYDGGLIDSSHVAIAWFKLDTPVDLAKIIKNHQPR
jgi:hypothetical protein